MLRLNRFSYVAPASLDDALGLLHQHGADAMLMAGGTDVLVNIKHRLEEPKVLVGIRALPELQRLEQSEDGWLTMGAGVTIKHIEQDPMVRNVYLALSEAAH
ncbi:MAG: FAD binding domain-containing protein, partial [Chloroflexota bacterium]